VKLKGGWKKLYNGKLHDLYPSPNIVGVIKSRKMRWARHVAGMKEYKNVSDHLENLGINGRIILKIPAWTGLIWFRLGQVAGSSKHGNEPSCSVKCWELFD
jgi:hypothetical protein